MTPLTAALYARVSTDGQHPDAQLAPLRAYAAARSWHPVEFVDHGVSGSRESRPALDALMAAAHARSIAAVCVVKLDRLARSTRHLVSLAADLDALGVDLVALDQAIDTSTPSGRLLFHVLAAIAEFERDLIRDRVRAGLDRARRNGVRLGAKRIHHVDPDVLIPLLQGGATLRGAARALGVHHSAVARNPVARAFITPRQSKDSEA